MRVIYYTNTAFFDAAISLMRSLSEKIDLFVVLEVSPESRTGTILDLTRTQLKPGINPAESILSSLLPVGVAEYWRKVKGIYIAGFDYPKSLHPDTICQGKTIADFIHTLNPDIIFFDDISLRLSLASFFMKDISWILGVHDPKPHAGEKNWRLTLSRKLMYPVAKHFILHNKFQEADFLKQYGISENRTSVVHLGAYDVYHNWQDGECLSEEKTILFFGRLSSYKGLDVLLEAIPIICERIGNIKINIIGKPVSGYKIPPVPELPNGGRINLINSYVSAGELARYFSETNCVICPYTDATQSGVVLTAYAFRKPVVATRVGGLPEYLLDGQTGLLVEPNNPAKLAEAVISLLEDVALSDSLEDGCSKIQVGTLNWESISDQYVKIFEKVIEHD